MKRPTFIHGVGVAFLLSFFGAALFAALGPFLGGALLLRALIPLLGFAYVLYLLGRSGARTGRVMTIAFWALAAGITWFMAPPLPIYLMVHAALVWLIRSLYFYDSFTPALMDLGLSTMSIAAAVWAVTRSGSIFLAIWCLFLVQALFAIIPRSIEPAKAHAERRTDDAFQRAQRNAEAALRRLSANN